MAVILAAGMRHPRWRAGSKETEMRPIQRRWLLPLLAGMLLSPGLLVGCAGRRPVTARQGPLTPDPSHVDELLGLTWGEAPTASMRRIAQVGPWTAYHADDLPSAVWGVPIREIALLYCCENRLGQISLTAVDAAGFQRLVALVVHAYGTPARMPGGGLVWEQEHFRVMAAVHAEQQLYGLTFNRFLGKPEPPVAPRATF